MCVDCLLYTTLQQVFGMSKDVPCVKLDPSVSPAASITTRCSACHVDMRYLMAYPGFGELDLAGCDTDTSCFMVCASYSMTLVLEVPESIAAMILPRLALSVLAELIVIVLTNALEWYKRRARCGWAEATATATAAAGIESWAATARCTAARATTER
jgi:hypothetical protein